MKYQLNINQKAWQKHFPDANLNHAVILDTIQTMCTIQGPGLLKDEQGFTFISLNLIIKEIPMMSINCKSGVSKYIQDLQNWGLIDTKINKRNQYIKVTAKYHKIFVTNYNQGQERGVHSDEQGVHCGERGVHSDEQGVHCGERGVHSDEPISNTNISNTTISNVDESKKTRTLKSDKINPVKEGETVGTKRPSRISIFRKKYEDNFLDKYSEPYNWGNFAKSGQQIKNLYSFLDKIYDYNTSVEIMDKCIEIFFNKPDRWAEDEKHPLYIFINKFNKLHIECKSSDDRVLLFNVN